VEHLRGILNITEFRIFEEPHFDGNYTTMAGLMLGGNFEVIFRGLQERYVVQFEVLCRTEYVAEQKITTEKLDRLGWKQNLPDAYRLLGGNPTLKVRKHERQSLHLQLIHF
jgi:hypothetical protein